MEQERKIVEEGLELGIKLERMKFACPDMELCEYLSKQKDQREFRQNYCHNATEYLNCGK